MMLVGCDGARSESSKLRFRNQITSEDVSKKVLTLMRAAGDALRHIHFVRGHHFMNEGKWVYSYEMVNDIIL